MKINVAFTVLSPNATHILFSNILLYVLILENCGFLVKPLTVYQLFIRSGVSRARL